MGNEQLQNHSLRLPMRAWNLMDSEDEVKQKAKSRTNMTEDPNTWSLQNPSCLLAKQIANAPEN
jgi:hypothetical protein